MGEPTDDQERKRRREQKVQRQLDEALADSFPASDPVAIVTSQEEEWDEARCHGNADGARTGQALAPDRRVAGALRAAVAALRGKASVASDFGDPRHAHPRQPVVIVN